MYPKLGFLWIWDVGSFDCDLEKRLGWLVSQNRKNYMIYDIFKAFLYHKMREIEAFMILFPEFVS